MTLYSALGRPVAATQESATSLTLANGSKIVSLPSKEETIRGYSRVSLLVCDEAARIPDPLYFAARPFLAVSGGALVALSSAYARLGWFYNEWVGSRPWQRTKITAYDCPRISREFLDEERETMGDRVFAREYLGEFAEADDAVFSLDDIEAACSDELEPVALWG
jgi:hypothetical protein